MTIDATSSSASLLAVQREIAVLKTQQDLQKATGEAMVDLVTRAPAPGRVDTYA